VRIAIVNQHFDTSSPPGPSGSLAIWSYQIGGRLAREWGWDVVVYEQPRPGAAPEQRIEGVTYRRVPTRPVDHYVARVLRRVGKLRRPQWAHYARPLHYRDYASRVARDIRARGCDVVHIHNFSQFVSPIREVNPAAMVALHMNCDWLAQLDRRMLETRLAKCDLIIGCSEHVTNGVRRRFPSHADRCTTSYNGADLQRFTPSRDGSGDGVKRVLFCGRVSPEKGVHDLVDAFDLVLRNDPTARLEILGGHGAAPREYMVAVSTDPKVRALERFYGEGADYPTAVKQRMTPPVAECTTFTKFLLQHEVAERVRQADVLVQPSLTDACPFPVCEAMACGVPVVGTRAGGIPELVEDGVTGLITESGDPPALAAALGRLLSDDAMRLKMGRNGRERAERLFSWDRAAEALDRCYRRALGGSPRRCVQRPRPVLAAASRPHTSFSAS
jgi:glycosyltransferase involved in cell wall biosynthesis